MWIFKLCRFCSNLKRFCKNYCIQSLYKIQWIYQNDTLDYKTQVLGLRKLIILQGG